jgi:integration host factor subunit beta
MTKNELIEKIALKLPHLTSKDVELAVKYTFNLLGDSLSGGNRIEIRGFGSFSLRTRKARVGRNPKTGEPVALPPKNVPHFKPGKELKSMVNDNSHYPIRD